MSKRGLSPKRVNNTLTVLGRMLRYAQELDIIDKVPRIKFMKVPPARTASYVLLALGDARGAGSDRPGTAGHSSLLTTQRYMHLTPNTGRDAIDVLDGKKWASFGHQARERG